MAERWGDLDQYIQEPLQNEAVANVTMAQLENALVTVGYPRHMAQKRVQSPEYENKEKGNDNV